MITSPSTRGSRRESAPTHFQTHREHFFICLELALDTTRKWNLKHHLGEKLKAI